jgi:hypothetical protein
MKLIALSSLGLRRHPDTADAVLQGLLSVAAGRMVTIDTATLRRRASMPTEHQPLAAHRIGLAEWLKEDTETYVPDHLAIHRAALELSPDRPLLLDAGGYALDAVVPVLHECRVAWFGLAQWHPAFVLLCDDVLLPHLSEELFDTFYVRPTQLTGYEAMQLAKGVRRDAMLAYWFGFKPGGNRRRVGRSLAWLERWVKRKEERTRRQIERWTP